MTDSIAIDCADLRIVFSSEDPALLTIVRAVAKHLPQRPGAEPLQPKVHAHLSRRSEVGWEPGDRTSRAFSPLDGYSFGSVFRAALCDALAPEGAVLHAAGAVVRDRSVLFLAPSEGGKSTIAELIGGDHQLLSDEAICVRPATGASGEYLAYGTCFWSSAAPQSGVYRGFPIGALCFLEKGELRCDPLTRREALPRFLGQVHLRESPRAGREGLDFAARLLERVPCYRLRFPLGARLTSTLERMVGRAG